MRPPSKTHRLDKASPSARACSHPAHSNPQRLRSPSPKAQTACSPSSTAQAFMPFSKMKAVIPCCPSSDPSKRRRRRCPMNRMSDKFSSRDGPSAVLPTAVERVPEARSPRRLRQPPAPRCCPWRAAQELRSVLRYRTLDMVRAERIVRARRADRAVHREALR